MRKLLRADFSRLFKSLLFRLGIGYSLFMGLVVVGNKYEDMITSPETAHIDYVLFSNCILMPVVAAVFISLFAGTEYGDGTLRNKLIAGHDRVRVYLSELIVCTAALWIFHLVNIGVILAAGLPLVGNVENGAGSLFALGLCSMAAILALSALFVLMAMLIHAKAGGAAAAILLSIAVLFGGLTIQARLDAPEYTSSYVISSIDDEGNTEEQIHKEKNPRYLVGAKREVFQFFHEFLPGGQMLQIAEQSPRHPGVLPVYAMTLTVLVTVCGAAAFGRKNIK